MSRSRRIAAAVSGVAWGLMAGGAHAVAPFTVVALPDTQYYTQTTANNELYFKGQTNWIVSHKTSNNIAFVLGLGDIQNDGNAYYAKANDPYSPDLTRPTGYVADDHEWINADAALDILDAGGVPYSVVAGNHDYIHHDIKAEPYNYLKWFGPQRFAGKSWFGGGSPATPTSLPGMDSYYIFDAGGRKYLNIGLQYAPDTYDLAWAQSVINAHPGIPTILTMHAMLDLDGYQDGRQNIFNQLAANNPQVLMMINGHINGTFRQTETNIAGQPVQQMLVDYQSTTFPGLFKGGGYMRLMEFDTDHSVVHVKSYSPVANNYLTDSTNQFDLPMDINGRFGAAAGTPSVTKTATFRQGVNGYGGTHETYVDATQPDASLSTQTGVWVDGDQDDTTAGNQPRHGLIRFDGLTGAAGAIPAGAVIQSATLTLTTSTVTNSQTGSSMSLYRMLRFWGDGATWNSLGSGVSTDGYEAILAANGTMTSTAQGAVVTFDVTESVFAWLSGAPNYGWAILPGGSDGWRFDSSEATTLTTRPTLSVTYLLANLTGDANLDGRIGPDDYALLDRGFAKHLTGWGNGDFNNDGVVNQADYLMIDATYAQQEGGLSPEFLAGREAQFGADYVTSLGTAVPEPGVLSVVAVVGMLAGRRRR